MKLPLSYPLEDHLVVLLSEEKLLLLNPTARFVWEQIDNGADLEGTVERFARRFEVSARQANRDVCSVYETIQSLCRPRAQIEEKDGSVSLFDSTHCLRRRYRLGQVVVEISFETRELETQLHPRFSHWEESECEPSVLTSIGRGEGGFCVTSSRGSRTFGGVSSSEAVGVLLRSMVECIYPDTQWLLMMHAGGVARGGRCIVFPGDKGKGKSTLTAGLVAEGFSYLGDDFIPLDGQARACSFPLQLGLKSGSWPMLESHFPELKGIVPVTVGSVQVKYLRLAQSLPPGRRDDLTHLVFPMYREEAEPFLRVLSPLDTLQRLVETQTWFSRDPDLAPRWIELLERIPASELSYGSLGDALELLSELDLR